LLFFLYRKMLSLGASKPWPEALEVLTGQKNLDAGPMLQYFDPLYKWLKEENRKTGTFVGWEKGRNGESFVC
jgi:Angiotensin-converting enzyme.